MNKPSFEEGLLQFVEELKDENEMTEKQKSILRASIKLFAEKGFHASSTSEIAKEAGVAEGTIFRHYKSKKDILLAVVAPVLVKFAAPFLLKDVREIFKEQAVKPFDEVATELFRNRLDLVLKNDKTIRILLQEAFFHDEIREALIATVFKDIKELVYKLIEDKMDAGELRPLPPQAVFRSILQSMIGLVMFRQVLDAEEFSEYSDEEQIGFTVDILMNGIGNR
ncbi:TetR/AcrR family transcriptional regulator [Brevibacillus invocatus]|uniref:TetR/AcrR family transcriptional regulator n=1 Tax=Brevibacillus invocatus TaxID=173959 RepID=UPI00203E2D62|nr:TetR/AcrR family transcriptional regulator [Brevibacillus invocatus]MCM3078733.1 TetR/AcrR family transcriptional regulator [Brevibacillus invocatus]MCM3428820.1 TetR/AcrR family transcriptional regulator [Brevibacillus invocatus]